MESAKGATKKTAQTDAAHVADVCSPQVHSAGQEARNARIAVIGETVVPTKANVSAETSLVASLKFVMTANVFAAISPVAVSQGCVSMEFADVVKTRVVGRENTVSIRIVFVTSFHVRGVVGQERHANLKPHPWVAE